MNRISKLYTLLVISVCFLYACDPEEIGQIVEFELPEEKPKLVVNAEYTVGEDSFFVMLQASRKVASNAPVLIIDNAKVELFHDGKKIADLPKKTIFNQSVIYQINDFNKTFKSEGTYTLKISADGFDAVEATQIVPPKPDISNILFKANEFIEPFGAKKIDQIQFDFKDPVTENFYNIELLTQLQDTVNKKKFYSPSSFYIDKQFSDNALGGNQDISHNISDLTFNGKNLNFKIGIASNGFFVSEPGIDFRKIKMIGYQVILKTHTKDRHLHIVSQIAKDQSIGNIFGEPIVLHSNIDNGYGIFSIRHIAKLDIVK